MNKKKKRKKKYSNNSSKKSRNKKTMQNNSTNQKQKPDQKKVIHSFLDNMEDGREFESILKYNPKVDLQKEIKRAINEIQTIRQKPLLCYLSNVVNNNIRAPKAIDINDDLPFSEMIGAVPDEKQEVDIMLVTPGGSAEQVSKLVDRLRSKFNKVSFIIPNIAMSAGTIFAASGDEIIMPPGGYIGPIDPQIPDKNGYFRPAQAVLTAIEDIQQRGENLLKEGKNPLWSDLQILNQIDPKEIGDALNASKYSSELVEEYLYKYKFKTWKTHSSNGSPVTDKEKKTRAKEIANLLCNNSLWKTHRRGINREIAWDVCKLKILHPEDIEGLEKSIRRFWALLYWIFENSPLFKIIISENYSIFRHDPSSVNKK